MENCNVISIMMLLISKFLGLYILPNGVLVMLFSLPFFH